MKVALFYSELEKLGGIKTFAYYIDRALKEFGIDVFCFSWEDIKYWYSLRKFLADKTVYGNLASKLIDHTYFIRLVRLFELNNVITFNLHGERLFLPTNIIYVHDPRLLSTIISNSSISVVKRVWYCPYIALLKQVVKLYKRSLLLVNSRYTANELKHITGLNSQVLYPPVDICKYKDLGIHDKPWVVTISRFSRFKNLEVVLEVAKRVRKARFFICGGINSTDDLSYYYWLRSLIIGDNLGNVVLLPNVSEQTKIILLNRARVYFHSMKNEQFGIAVVEAMASGLIPIVHKSGGPWEDILMEKQGLYGYAYDSLEEAVSLLEYVLNEYPTLVRSLSPRSRAERFSYENFKRNFLRYMQKFSK